MSIGRQLATATTNTDKTEQLPKDENAMRWGRGSALQALQEWRPGLRDGEARQVGQ